MINQTAKGGNAKKVRAASKVEFSRKSALLIVPVPKAPAKPEVQPAEDFEQALDLLKVDFQFKLRRLDGSTEKEQVAIRTLEDFEEHGIAHQSAILREQKIQMDFLHEFLHELTNSSGFVEEMQELLASEKKELLISYLRGWSGQFKKNRSEIMKLLAS